jgi:hypothetical protein
MSADAAELVVLTFVHPDGTTRDTYLLSTAAAANQAAALLLLSRLDEWHPNAPGEAIVSRFLAGDAAGAVEAWSDFHERHPGWGEVVLESVTLDAFPLDLEDVRQKAHAWLHEDELA